MGAVLVTGGAGYIGSHNVLALLTQGYDVVIFDSLETGHKEIVEVLSKINACGKLVKFVKGDLKNYGNIESVFKNFKVDAVLHFAAYSLVGESVNNPQKYYINNIYGTLNLLKAMIENEVNKIVFSSSAAIYGEPEYIPIDEKHPKNPINPYGKSKLIIENILEDYDKAYGIRSVRLRYFNVAGANSEAVLGEWHNSETHLIPNILKSTFGGKEVFQMFGTDYDTKDGTCIRDYINIEDLADAHLKALKYLLDGGPSDFFNLGTKNGDSVRDVFKTCEEVTGKNIPVEIKPRRSGDPAKLIADNKKAFDILHWTPVKTLKDSIKTAYEWEKFLQK